MNRDLALVALLAANLCACGNLSDSELPSDRAAFTNDNRLVVLTERGIKLYDGQLDQELGTASVPGDPCWPLAVADDGSLAAVGHREPTGARILVYQPGTGELVRSIPSVESFGAVLSPAGDLLFDQHFTMFRTSDGAALWSLRPVTTGMPALPGSRHASVTPVFSADGKTLYLADEHYLLAVDTATGANQVLITAEGGITGLARLADGTLVLGLSAYTSVPSADNPNPEFRDWYAVYGTDGTPLRQFDQFSGFHFSGDASIDCVADLCAAQVQDAGTPATGPLQTFHVVVWRPDGTLVRALAVPNPVAYRPGRSLLSLSPDGGRLVVAAGSVLLYDVATGNLLRERSYTTGAF